MSDAPPIRLLVDPPQDGAWNMAVDEALMRSVGSEENGEGNPAVLRFYEWSQPTLSLGYFQQRASREQHAASKDIPLVRRNSGGGAIVHDREITYSLTISETVAFSKFGKSSLFYEIMHLALIEALSELGVEANMVSELQNELEGEFLCFQRRAPNDVVVKGHKVCGSAQRKKFKAISQHGSVILGTSPNAPEIIGINDITGQEIQSHGLRESWVLRIADHLKSEFGPSTLTEKESKLAQEIREVKFAAVKWNSRR